MCTRQPASRGVHEEGGGCSSLSPRRRVRSHSLYSACHTYTHIHTPSKQRLRHEDLRQFVFCFLKCFRIISLQLNTLSLSLPLQYVVRRGRRTNTRVTSIFAGARREVCIHSRTCTCRARHRALHARST